MRATFMKRNLFEYLSLISSAACVICIALNYLTNLSPITGIWFPLYVIVVFTLSVFFSFRTIQWLLQLNKPLSYDLDYLLKKYPFLSYASRLLPKFSIYPKNPIRSEPSSKDYDTNELSIISTVLERKLVSSWYVPYVSQEIGFPFACKEMLDQMISKTFQISNKIDTPGLYTDICSILLSHLKEYKRAFKKLEQNHNGDIKGHYRMCHPTSISSASQNTRNKKYPSAEHCTNIMRIVLKELMPWELWDTPHSELLVRILSKRLDEFIGSTLIEPGWLNQNLLKLLNKEKTREGNVNQATANDNKGQSETIKRENTEINTSSANMEKDLSAKASVQNTNMNDNAQTTTVESGLSALITKSTAPILLRAIADQMQDSEDNSSPAKSISEVGKSETDTKTSEPVEIQMSPQLRQRRGRQGRNEVKIYDRIVEGSVKTWESDVDLQCISLGQDLLASLDGEISLSRLWESDNAETGDSWSPNPPQNKSPQPLWFGEEDALEADLSEGSPPKPQQSATKPDHPSPNFSLSNIHNIKDLQSTVEQAKHKIGDLQVAQQLRKPIDVPVSCDAPSSAGVC